MDQSPIYSVTAQCRDCYKCVRHCPVKAIRVENDHATVTPERCILCGRCVGVCSHEAKQVRDDLPRVRTMIGTGAFAVASLAPSFVSEFPGVRPAQIAAALRKVGFQAVHETAEGAERVSKDVAAMLDHAKKGLFLSTACPVAVELITHYHPEFAKCLTPVMPPMMAHARLLKSLYGSRAEVVFLGPCIAKKRDADLHPDLLFAALTFEELRHWFIMQGIEPGELADDPDFHGTGPGAFYPIEGGMNRTTRHFLTRTDLNETMMAVSGIEHIADELESIQELAATKPVFLELLACEGGCIAGPKAKARNAISAQLEVVDYAAAGGEREPKPADIAVAYPAAPIAAAKYTDEQMAATLRLLGKYQPEDELNCGGCGYGTCRALAVAILDGHAEPQMCVSHMRQLAQQKSNALTRVLPYGLVVANEQLKVVECNERFAKLLGDDLSMAYEARPGLRDADLVRILPFPQLFTAVLRSGEEIVRKNIKLGDKYFSISIFNVEKGRLIGALLLDVTETETHRQQLIEKSREVILNTTKTVQEIAYKLGKNSAQSELILNSVTDLFAAEPAIEPDKED